MTLPLIADAIRRCAGEALSIQRTLLHQWCAGQEADLMPTIRRLRGLAAEMEATAQLLEQQQIHDRRR